MRHYMDMVEGVATRQRKPLDQITVQDVIAAMNEDGDLIEIARNHIAAYDDPNVISDMIDSSLKQAKSFYDNYSTGTPFTIFRGMRSLDLKRGIGSHWTTDRAVTEGFGKIVLQGITTSQNVDWASTLARCIMFDDAEKEVVIHTGTTVMVRSITFDGPGHAFKVVA